MIGLVTTIERPGCGNTWTKSPPSYLRFPAASSAKIVATHVSSCTNLFHIKNDRCESVGSRGPAVTTYNRWGNAACLGVGRMRTRIGLEVAEGIAYCTEFPSEPTA